MKYLIGVQDFGEIRRDGYVYVEKTALAYMTNKSQMVYGQ